MEDGLCAVYGSWEEGVEGPGEVAVRDACCLLPPASPAAVEEVVGVRADPNLGRAGIGGVPKPGRVAETGPTPPRGAVPLR